MLLVYGLQDHLSCIENSILQSAQIRGFHASCLLRKRYRFWKRDINPFSKSRCHKSHSQSTFFFSRSNISRKLPVFQWSQFTLERWNVCHKLSINTVHKYCQLLCLIEQISYHSLSGSWQLWPFTTWKSKTCNRKIEPVEQRFVYSTNLASLNDHFLSNPLAWF